MKLQLLAWLGSSSDSRTQFLLAATSSIHLASQNACTGHFFNCSCEQKPRVVS
jgi:hypothetical protein